MDSAGELTESRSISCPFCGRRSNLSIELPVMQPRTWTHNCPTCGKPWKVSLGSRRGLPQLDVSPIIATKAKTATKARKPKTVKAKTPAKAKKAKPTKTVKAKKAKPKR